MMCDSIDSRRRKRYIGLCGVMSLRVDVEGNHVCLSNDDDDGITE